MSKDGIPYVGRPYRIHQTSPTLHAKEGINIPIDRHAWITDGVVRDIEEGLPLITETPLAKSYTDAIESDKRIKSLQMSCLKTFFKEGEYWRVLTSLFLFGPDLITFISIVTMIIYSDRVEGDVFARRPVDFLIFWGCGAAAL